MQAWREAWKGMYWIIQICYLCGSAMECKEKRLHIFQIKVSTVKTCILYSHLGKIVCAHPHTHTNTHKEVR